jgi:hypothetical protein
LEVQQLHSRKKNLYLVETTAASFMKKINFLVGIAASFEIKKLVGRQQLHLR